ncbi:MAG: aminotransferase class III-fold pyridoxal phosphate-dependent enzyme, partial [Stellaceae bacterium]
MDSAAALAEADRRHLIHPLHHPRDHEHPILVVEGRGEMLIDADGKQYIDGLSSLWNVNAGHGRKELAEAAATQMAKLAFASAYAGASNIPSIRLAEKLVKLAYSSSSAVYFTTAGAESNESAFKTARFFWKLVGKPDKVKVISRHWGY